MQTEESPLKFPPEGMSPSVHAAIEHIIWTLQRAPKVYEMFRDDFAELREMLTVLEIKAVQ